MRNNLLEIHAVRTRQNGILLDGSRDAFRRLGAALEEGLSETFRLRRDERARDAELSELRIIRRSRPDEPVLLRIEDDSLIIEGGRNKAAMLGGGLLSLASSPLKVTPTSVPTHLDIEYYETHAFLAPTVVWLSVRVEDTG
jgi:hypothetical protein